MIFLTYLVWLEIVELANNNNLAEGTEFIKKEIVIHKISIEYI